jgi:hypothetical protein
MIRGGSPSDTGWVQRLLSLSDAIAGAKRRCDQGNDAVLKFFHGSRRRNVDILCSQLSVRF